MIAFNTQKNDTEGPSQSCEPGALLNSFLSYNTMVVFPEVVIEILALKGSS